MGYTQLIHLNIISSDGIHTTDTPQYH